MVSDADIEDNLETDMSKLEISVIEAHQNTNCNALVNENGVSCENHVDKIVTSDLASKLDDMSISSVKDKDDVNNDMIKNLCNQDEVAKDSSRDNMPNNKLISSQTGNVMLNGNPTIDNSCLSLEEDKHCDNKVNVDQGQLINTENKSPDNNLQKTKIEYLKEARSYSMNTLAPRYVRKDFLFNQSLHLKKIKYRSSF